MTAIQGSGAERGGIYVGAAGTAPDVRHSGCARFPDSPLSAVQGSGGIVNEVFLCWRLTLGTGQMIEMWELDNGEFELLFVEQGRRLREVVHAATLTLHEAEIVASKIQMAIAPVAAETKVP